MLSRGDSLISMSTHAQCRCCNVNIAACGEHMANSVVKTKDFWRRRRKSKKSFVFARNLSSSPQNLSSSPQNPSSWLNWHDWQYWRRKHKLTAVTFSKNFGPLAQMNNFTFNIKLSKKPTHHYGQVNTFLTCPQTNSTRLGRADEWRNPVES